MTRFANLSSVRTAFETQGDGPAIVLIHGAEANRRSFDALALALARHAHVVTYDQRGCGESVSKGGEHHVPDLADDAAELMAHLGHARYAVLGTSLGGRIAQALAQRHADKVDSLVLCNTWPLDRGLADIHPAGIARLQALRAGLPATARDLASMFYTPQHVDEHPALAQRFATPPVDSKRGALALEAHDFAPERIRLPVLCLSGAQDALVPPGIMALLARRFPNAVLQSLAGVGHSAAVQSPAAMARRVATFLGEHCARDATASGR